MRGARRCADPAADWSQREEQIVNNKAVVAAVSSAYVRLHARRVALGATVVALAVYLLACTIADLMVVDRLNGSIDSRMATRLVFLTYDVSHPAGRAWTIGNPLDVASGDLGDAPILAWFVPSGAKTAERLVADAPILPRGDLHPGHLVDSRVAGRNLRFDVAALRAGRIVVATSTKEVTSVRDALFVIEGVLAPVLLLALFLVATIIGRRAATPIERSRLRQLEFTADASQELRAPLGVIEAEISLALGANRSASAYRQVLERVAGESKYLRRIVEDLLWLARLESDPEGPPNEFVDLESMVRACLDRSRLLALRGGRVISVAGSGSFPALILARADSLDRLVSVLLDDACRHTAEGGRIDLAVAASVDRVVLAVDDDGPRVAEDERERIMERLHRASTGSGGAGLGVSIAAAVVRTTDGEWIVSTSPLGGARIRVSWPRVRAVDGCAAPIEHTVESALSTSHSISR